MNQTDGFETVGATNFAPSGVTTNGSDFWVVGLSDNFLFHHNAFGDNQTDGFDMSGAGVNQPQGITTNGSDFWVIDDGDDFVYHFAWEGTNITNGFSTLALLGIIPSSFHIILYGIFRSA